MWVVLSRVLLVLCIAFFLLLHVVDSKAYVSQADDSSTNSPGNEPA